MHPKLYEPKLKILKKGEKKSTRDGKESNNIWNRSIKKLEVGGARGGIVGIRGGPRYDRGRNEGYPSKRRITPGVRATG